MPKIKLTKGELKRQRDSLAQYRHYLPTLQLKKQQLQIKIHLIQRELDDKFMALQNKEETILHWIGLLADPGIDIKKWILPVDVISEGQNIAGANIPVFKEARFELLDYDLYTTPFWIDRGIKELREFFSLFVEIRIIRKQIEILREELRVTTQRVNLFEKVKIPECLENIRVIRIYLGDQQANAVGISKVAKRKIEASIQVIF